LRLAEWHRRTTPPRRPQWCSIQARRPQTGFFETMGRPKGPARKVSRHDTGCSSPGSVPSPNREVLGRASQVRSPRGSDQKAWTYRFKTEITEDERLRELKECSGQILGISRNRIRGQRAAKDVACSYSIQCPENCREQIKGPWCNRGVGDPVYFGRGRIQERSEESPHPRPVVFR
jgi:hypothetical protein